jgi:choline dehydrogenase
MPKSEGTALFDGHPYDYIVVGAGSAGCVVAARLSEGNCKVLLLEAGPRDSSPWIHFPMGYAKLYADPRFNWMRESEPEECLRERRLFLPAGRVLGGSSSINCMMYIRGNTLDFDDWSKAGCTGWSYADVLPYFRKSEDQARGSDAWHGVEGPLKVSDQSFFRELPQALCAAAKQAGLAENCDFNGPVQDGFGYYQMNTHRGKRWSAAKAYLAPASRRSNLRVVTKAVVERIEIEGGVAVGVAFRRGSRQWRALARSEIIVCAGVFGSPQLLMLSGVGPVDDLQSHGIACLRDASEMGANLQDHTAAQVMFRCSKPITINDLVNSRLRLAWAGLRYLVGRGGYLSETGIHVGGFARSTDTQDRPDIQMSMAAWSVAERTSKGATPHRFSAFSFSPVHLNPDARGSVRLRSRHPHDAPLIRFNFFRSPYDIAAMMYGIRLVRHICSQAAMRPCITSELQPGVTVRSDEALLDFIRRIGGSDYHSAGTCRMGADAAAVVDPRLRVKGIAKLRVVDASIMPRVVRGNTHASTVMIGEKAADMIRQDGGQ